MHDSFQLSDSGATGVWRQVAQVPEYAVKPASADDYVQRMDQQLWNHPRSCEPIEEPERPERTWASWDMAVAFAVHVMSMRPGAARDRMEQRCLDALENAIRAGCEPPAPDHRDFAAVARNPRFHQIIGAFA